MLWSWSQSCYRVHGRPDLVGPRSEVQARNGLWDLDFPGAGMGSTRLSTSISKSKRLWEELEQKHDPRVMVQIACLCLHSQFLCALNSTAPVVRLDPLDGHGSSDSRRVSSIFGWSAARVVRSRVAKKSGPVLPPVDDWSFEQRMKESLDLLSLMHELGEPPDPSLYCILLKSCADSRHLQMGVEVHRHAERHRVDADVFVANNLITMYSNCGRLSEARKVFDEMPRRNVVSWTSIISAYCQLGRYGESLRLYDKMRAEGVRPNVFTYAVVLKSCARMQDFEKGREVHQEVIKDNCESDNYVIIALVDMYAKCGNMAKARELFEKIPERNAVAYTAMIEGYNNLDVSTNEALDLIQQMLYSGVDDEFVKEVGYSCMIRSCSKATALRLGQGIHARLIKLGDNPGDQTTNQLIEFYAKCSKLKVAIFLFTMLHIKPAQFWGMLILACAKEGLNWDALSLFTKMLHENVVPDSSLLCCIVDVCVCLSAVKEGKQIHAMVIKVCYGSLDKSVRGSLINLCNRS